MPAAVVRKLVAPLGILALAALLAIGTMSALAASPDPSPSASASGGPALGGDPAKGQQLYNQSGCTACHGASLEGGVGPKLNPLTKISGSPDFKKLDDPAVAAYLVDTIANGKAPSDGYAQMPARGGAKISDQDVKDIVAYLLQANSSKEAPPLSPTDLARSNVFWVAVGIGVMVLLTYLLAQYNMRWIGRRASARKDGL